MADLRLDLDRAASPASSSKHVAFENKCQVIPEGDCSDLRKLLSLNPARAKSPPIAAPVSRSASLIVRAISPQLTRSKSPQQAKRLSGLGTAAPSSSTSWRNRITSWGSHETQSHSIAANVASSLPAASQASSSGIAGPRLVAPVPARGAAHMIPSNDDDLLDDESDAASPSIEGVIEFDDVHAEFQHAVSGKASQRQHLGMGRTTTAPPMLAAPRPSSSLAFSRASPNSLLKSCLVRSQTPQAPGPPPLDGDGMSLLRPVRSHDRATCMTRRRRADGIPVVGTSPQSSSEDEGGPCGWRPDSPACEAGVKGQEQAGAVTDKASKSRWKRFRRAFSESTPAYEHQPPPPPPRKQPSPSIKDEDAIKREIAAGRWPFEAPLNSECSCKNCQERIEVGLRSDYEPKWTRAARVRWLEAQEIAAEKSKSGTASTKATLTSSASRPAIQADEVAQLHNETVQPMTAAELAEEPTSPQMEKDESGICAILEEAVRNPCNPTGLEEGDETLRREIIARRQQMSRPSPVMRRGARSMLRQLEEAERIECEAAKRRSQSRESRPGCGSGRSSPASPAMSPSLPSTPDSFSSTPQEPMHENRSANQASYFDMPPPQRARSPLIPADVASKARHNPQIETNSSAFAMGNIAQSLEAVVASMSNSPATSPTME